YGIAWREIPADQHNRGTGFTRTQPASVAVKGSAPLWINGFQGGESSHDKCRKMIHAHDEHGVRCATLNHFRALLNRDQTRHARGGNALHRTSCAVCGSEIVREQVALQMSARSGGTSATVGQTFERFNVGFCSGENE